MSSETMNLGWGRFALQLGAAILAIIGAYIAGEILSSTRETTWNFAIATNFIMLPFIAILLVFRVPYRRDEFERRLRNWSMTQSAIWILLLGVVVNLLWHLAQAGNVLITTYMMPGLFFLCHAIYSQYLRYKIANGETNAFSDGSNCR